MVIYTNGIATLDGGKKGRNGMRRQVRWQVKGGDLQVPRGQRCGVKLILAFTSITLRHLTRERRGGRMT